MQEKPLGGPPLGEVRLAMLAWAVLVAGLTLVAMIPAFLGLFVVLPLLGHATWHLYRLMVEAGGKNPATGNTAP